MLRSASLSCAPAPETSSADSCLPSVRWSSTARRRKHRTLAASRASSAAAATRAGVEPAHAQRSGPASESVPGSPRARIPMPACQHPRRVIGGPWVPASTGVSVSCSEGVGGAAFKPVVVAQAAAASTIGAARLRLQKGAHRGGQHRRRGALFPLNCQPCTYGSQRRRATAAQHHFVRARASEPPPPLRSRALGLTATRRACRGLPGTRPPPRHASFVAVRQHARPRLRTSPVSPGGVLTTSEIGPSQRGGVEPSSLAPCRPGLSIR